jgi:type IV pilus assembly protein PilQ
MDMCKLYKAAGLLFFAAASVYPVGAQSASAERKASAPGKGVTTDVRLLDETAGPIGESPATQPVAKNGSQQVSVSDAGTVEIHVNEANLVEVLRMLSLQSQKNIVASKEVRGTVTANLYNVTIKEALDAILKAYGYAYREKGNFIFVYSAKELAELEKAERQMTTEVFRLHYTPAANAANMIKPALSTEGQVAMTTAATTGLEGSNKGSTGGGGGKQNTGGDSHAVEDILVIRDFPDNIDRVRKILKEIDHRPQQVLVEATIIAVRLDENNNLGIDFNILGGVDFAKVFHENGQITNARLPLGTTAEPFPIDRSRSFGTGNNMTSGLTPGFKVGFVSSDVSIFLNALEAVSNTMVLANPKVLTLNKQQGEVLVGREDGYLTTTVTDTTAVQTVEFLQTGTRLVFRPFIADDGYIRMEIHPEDSSGTVVGGLPSKSTTEITTNILVKDGNTVILGGLFRESSTTGKRQVPGLGNVPVVGALFRNQEDRTFREEIIIMLTPHIVKDERAYSDVSLEVLKDMEKMRVGVRKGMMPWGRERLSEACYDKAVAEMSKPEPNRKKALWHLDCATNLNPIFLEAIKMKESLTGRELSEVDNSSIRTFVKQQILAERAGGAVRHAPATQPVNPPAPPASPAAQAPTTQPVAEADQPPTDCAESCASVAQEESEPQPLSEMSEQAKPLAEAALTPAAPATQPAAAAAETATEVTVIELPADEADAEPESDDQPN